ncbi:transposable element Tcb2 transposase [Trichonephila clavipes]|nr:transposable element Tcb2 transposase [Trichonephila clavipes]
MPASSIRRWLQHRGLCTRVPLYRIPLTANHRRLGLQWAHEHRAWPADWYQVVFSDESRFNLHGHIMAAFVRRYAAERCLPECVIERHSVLTLGVTQNIACPQVAKTVRDFCSAQRMQLLLWLAYSPDMSPIEHVWDLVGLRLARDLRPAASKTNFCCACKQYGILFPKQTFEICLAPCHVV